MLAHLGPRLARVLLDDLLRSGLGLSQMLAKHIHHVEIAVCGEGCPTLATAPSFSFLGTAFFLVTPVGFAEAATGGFAAGLVFVGF